jgi:hypothetical protein
MTAARIRLNKSNQYQRLIDQNKNSEFKEIRTLYVFTIFNFCDLNCSLVVLGS